MTKIGCRADSLWIFDRALVRITVFWEDGVLARTIALPAHGVGVLHGDGRVTIQSDRAVRPSASNRDSLSLQELTGAGRLTPIRYPAPYAHPALCYSVAGRTVVGLQPFDDGHLVAEAAGGSGFWFVQQANENGGAQLHIERLPVRSRTPDR